MGAGVSGGCRGGVCVGGVWVGGCGGDKDRG